MQCQTTQSIDSTKVSIFLLRATLTGYCKDKIRDARTWPGMTEQTSWHNDHILILLSYHVFTTGSTLMACFVALRAVFPPGVRISVATLGCVGQA